AQGAVAPYPTTMVPVDQYRMPREAEIALAKSAAPAAIANDADVMVLGASGYETAVKGKNGFVCIVGRAWSRDFGLPDFWSPKTRAPVCFNQAAAHSVLDWYLIRTTWALAGVSEADMQERSKKSPAASGIRPPAPGSMAFMLSKDGYINEDAKGPWRPHVMFFAPLITPAAWGANVDVSPLFVNDAPTATYTTFNIPVAQWSDGTQDH
ncbi:MAG TPA: hypothetical protein VH113_02510, partial [Gemmatimonadales bacterium]|nr:hypothetical protein [Gemmatimonadales bacterium]